MISILKIIILSLVSILVLFILTKIMGNKEISQLSMFDYITGITIGSIAAEMATALEDDFWQPLIAMIIYGFISFIISYLSNKSIKFRRIISGHSLILLDNGILYKKNFNTAKLDLNEFLMMCRINGYFNLSDIQTAILEPNGKISFIPSVANAPVTNQNLNLSPKQEKISINVIIDGKILRENLLSTGNDEVWLEGELGKQNISDISTVFLATCDSENNLNVYKQDYTDNDKHDNFI